MTGSVSALSTIVLALAGGIVLGFIAGVMATLWWVGRRRAQGRPVPTFTDPAETPPPTERSIRPRRPLYGGEHLSKLGLTLLILSLFGIVVGVYATVSTTTANACQATFNRSFIAAQRERAGAAGLDREAIRRQRAVTRDTLAAMVGLLTADVDRNDPAAGVRVRDEFLTKIRDGDRRLAEVDRLDMAAEEQRKANPLPPEPDC